MWRYRGALGGENGAYGSRVTVLGDVTCWNVAGHGASLFLGDVTLCIGSWPYVVLLLISSFNMSLCVSSYVA